MKIKFIVAIMFFCLLSCQRDVESCECKQVIINAWSTISADAIRSTGLKAQIRDPTQIQDIKNFALNLERLDVDYGEMDVRMVLDLLCENGRKSTILINNTYIQISGKNYKFPKGQLDKLGIEQIEELDWF